MDAASAKKRERKEEERGGGGGRGSEISGGASKKPRRLSQKGRPGESNDDDDGSKPGITNGEVLKTLVSSGYLGPEEVKDLLLSETNKDLNTAFVRCVGSNGENSSRDANTILWKSVLVGILDGNEHDAEQLLKNTGWSPHNCLTKLGFEKEKDRKKSPVPRPLEYSPSDYTIIIKFRFGDKVCCKSFGGDQVTQLFKSGKATIMFDEPLFERHFPENQKKMITKDGKKIVGIKLGKKLSYEIRIMRPNCPSQNGGTLKLGSETIRSGRFDAVYGEGCVLNVRRSTRFLSHQLKSSYGQKLVTKHFGNNHRFGCKVNVEWKHIGSSSGTAKFAAVGLTIVAQFALSVQGIVETTILKDAAELSAIKKGEVEFAHFIEALDGW